MIGTVVRRFILALALLGATAGAAMAAAPTVETGPLSRLSPIGATLTGTVNPNGEATTFVFEYGETTSYGASAPATPGNPGAGTTAVTARAAITGLKPGTLYNYRLTATNPSGLSQGTNQTFTTPTENLPLPSASTGTATNVGNTNATLTGTVNPNGQPTAYHFEYGLTAEYGSRTGGKQAGSGTTDAAASQAVANLQTGATYHFRIVAESLAGAFNGTDMTFTTGGGPPPTAPVPTTGAAEGIAATAATLTGTVDPKGLDTGYTFEWGTTTAYGNATALGAVPGAAGLMVVGAPLTGLLPSTTYHFRLAASSTGGTIFGADGTFTTLADGTTPPPTTTTPTPTGPGTTPTVPLPPAGPPSATTGPVSQAIPTAATLTGTVNPNGQVVLYVFQYGTTTAYAMHAAGKRTAATVGPIAVSSDIFKLQPNTTYHYRLSAIAESGAVALGEDMTFATPPVGGATGAGDQRCSIGPWGLPPRRSLPPGFVLVKTGAKSAVGRGGYLAVNRACFPNVQGTTKPAKCTFGPWKNPVRVPDGFRLVKTGLNNPRGRGGYLLLSTACFPAPGGTTSPTTPTPGPPNQGFF
jgi:hypothetical protein